MDDKKFEDSRKAFEEAVFGSYFISTIRRNENIPQPRIADALDFVSTCELTKDQFCNRVNGLYTRTEVSAMWHGWKLCLERMRQQNKAGLNE